MFLFTAVDAVFRSPPTRVSNPIAILSSIEPLVPSSKAPPAAKPIRTFAFSATPIAPPAFLPIATLEPPAVRASKAA